MIFKANADILEHVCSFLTLDDSFALASINKQMHNLICRFEFENDFVYNFDNRHTSMEFLKYRVHKLKFTGTIVSYN